MKKYILLYMKEMKKIRKVWLFFLLMYGVGLFSFLFSPSQMAFNSHLSFLFIMPPAIAASPAVFGFSLNDDLKNGNLCQLHSLPLPHYIVILTKVLAALTAGAVPVIGYICLYFFYNPIGFVSRRGMTLVEEILMFISIHFWLLGIASIVAGVMFISTRYRSLTGLITIISTFFISFKFIQISARFFRLIHIELLYGKPYNLFWMFLFIGFLFTIVGFFLYDKFAEV